VLLLVNLALFGLTLPEGMFDTIKRAIGDIYRRFVLLSDFFVDDISILLERESLVVVHSYFYLLFRGEKFLPV